MKNKNDYAGTLELINKDEMVDRTLDQAIDGNLEGVKKALKIAQAIEEKRVLLVPVKPSDAVLESMEEQYMPFGEMIAAYDAIRFAVDTEKLIEEICGE